MFGEEIYGQITGISAQPGIIPRLVINLTAKTKSLVLEVVNVLASAKVAFRESASTFGEELYIGPAYVERWAPTMPPANDVRWTFAVDLNPRLIQLIEGKRHGRDVWLRLTVMICAVERGTTDVTPKRVACGDITQPGYQYIGLLVPRSQWLDTLKGMGYGEYYEMDIPLPRLAKTSVVNPVLPILQRAWEHFENGSDRETLAACWEAMEVLAKKQGGKQPGQNEFAQMLRGIGHAEKARKVADALRYWTDLLHLGRHEHEPSVEVDHRDAEFALIVTHACFAYLAKAGVSKIGQAARPQRAKGSMDI